MLPAKAWTNGVCDQSDMLRLLELCDQLQERQRQMAAVCDDLDVHIIQIIGSLDHACDPEAVFSDDAAASGIEMRDMPVADLKRPADCIKIGVGMCDAQCDPIVTRKAGKFIRTGQLRRNAPAPKMPLCGLAYGVIFCWVKGLDLLLILRACLLGRDIQPLHMQTQ